MAAEVGGWELVWVTQGIFNPSVSLEDCPLWDATRIHKSEPFCWNSPSLGCFLTREYLRIAKTVVFELWVPRVAVRNVFTSLPNDMCLLHSEQLEWPLLLLPLGFHSCAAGAAICRAAQCDKSSELWGFTKNVCAWGEGAEAGGQAGSRLYFLSFVNQASHVLFF